jgi:hypothetical protein
MRWISRSALVTGLIIMGAVTGTKGTIGFGCLVTTATVVIGGSLAITSSEVDMTRVMRGSISAITASGVNRSCES